MKLRLVQCRPKQDFEANLDFTKISIKKAAKKGCDLIVFPEMFLTGYIVTEKTKFIAITKINNKTNDLQNICKLNNIAYVFGFPRKDKSNVFNS